MAKRALDALNGLNHLAGAVLCFLGRHKIPKPSEPYFAVCRRCKTSALERDSRAS